MPQLTAAVWEPLTLEAVGRRDVVAGFCGVRGGGKGGVALAAMAVWPMEERSCRLLFLKREGQGAERIVLLLRPLVAENTNSSIDAWCLSNLEQC